jgi:predicted metalloprotease with PDZ domain
VLTFRHAELVSASPLGRNNRAAPLVVVAPSNDVLPIPMNFPLFAIATIACIAHAADATYRVRLDLAGCHSDRITVSVELPTTLSCTECRYILPRSVPGTYSLDRYGRFVTDAVAFDREGTQLPVRRDDGDIVVSGTPARIVYQVNDTWDDPDGRDVFNPTGSNIQCDSNFVLNFHAMVGYVEGYKDLPYQVTIVKPRGFYGATSLRRVADTDTADVFRARSYMELVDNPAMYCLPDTASFDQSGTRVMVAVYSPNKVMRAHAVAAMLRPTLAAVARLLGTMPVDRYTFLFYFAGRQQTDIVGNMSFGALEHAHSSLYFLPEGRGAENTAREMIQSTAAHEFLHILVPLNLHSREIADFDFRSPRMSRHLWLYEGCTEYFQMLARARDTLLEPKEFLRELLGNLRTMQLFYRERSASLVELSQRVLEPDYQKLYPVVYMHGPVVAFCLDVTIRRLTDGRMTLLDLIRRAMDKYGPDRPFRDDELFDELTAMVHPSLREFFRRYVEGTELPPIGECIAALGYRYSDSAQVEAYQFESASLMLSRSSDIPIVVTRQPQNDFGFRNGDTLVRINGVLVTPENKYELVSQAIWAPQTPDTVRVLVRRSDGEVELRAAPRRTMRTVRHTFSEDPSASPEALAFRQRFFGKAE